jgi:hypothetical protein
MRRYWSDPEWVENRIRQSLLSLRKRPTGLERNLIDFFAKYNLPFKYTGDGSFLIGFKNPDFVDVNGLKICVEVRNSYFNKFCKDGEHYAIKRKQHFAQYGWDCIVLETKKRSLDEETILNTLGKQIEARGIIICRLP